MDLRQRAQLHSLSVLMALLHMRALTREQLGKQD
jgi:hypothetical protein